MNVPNLCTYLLIGFLFAAHTEAQTPLITVETVPVAHPGNGNDSPSGYGSVGYPYRIGKYEVTIEQYAVFLNSVAQTNTNSDIVNLWNSNMATDFSSAGISRGGVLGNYFYNVTGINGASAKRPISYVSWFDAARFCNWLHNGATNGASTETGAYRLDGPFFPTDGPPAVVRNPDSKWWIPTVDEWYKAAYYKSGSTNVGYWLYPTRSNAEPGNAVGDGANQANFLQMRRDQGVGFFSVTQTPFSEISSSQNYLTDVGAFSESPGAYGTFDQGGNVSEWFGRTNGGSLGKDPSQWVGFAGGNWYVDGYYLSSEGSINAAGPGTENSAVGFRVATVPTPVAAITSGPFKADSAVDKAFSYKITANNSPSTFQATGLPEGLKVNTTTGVISGRPNKAGKFNVTISANNAGTGTVSAILALEVAKGAQSITFNPKKTESFKKGRTFTLSATASSKLRVRFNSDKPSILSIEDNKATILRKGVVTITASQPGNSNYRAAEPVPHTITIE